MEYDWKEVERMLEKPGTRLLRDLTEGDRFELHLVSKTAGAPLIGIFIRNGTPKHAISFAQSCRAVRRTSILEPLRLILDSWNQALQQELRITVEAAHGKNGRRLPQIEAWFNRVPGTAEIGKSSDLIRLSLHVQPFPRRRLRATS